MCVLGFVLLHVADIIGRLEGTETSMSFSSSSDCPAFKSTEAESPYASMAKQMTEDVIELTQDFPVTNNRGIILHTIRKCKERLVFQAAFFRGYLSLRGGV